MLDPSSTGAGPDESVAPPATVAQLKEALEEALKVNYELQLDKLARDSLVQVSYSLVSPLSWRGVRKLPLDAGFRCWWSFPSLVLSEGGCNLSSWNYVVYLHRAGSLQPIAAHGATVFLYVRGGERKAQTPLRG